MQVIAPVAVAATPLYASWGGRFAAWLMDIVIVGVPLFVATGAFWVEATAPASTTGVIATGIAVALALVFFPCYFGVMQGGRRGQTLGKRATRIAVRRADTLERVGYSRSFARAIAFMAIWITPDLLPLLPLGAFSFVLVLSWLPLLDGLWPLWDKRNQALHDKVANTVVIRM